MLRELNSGHQGTVRTYRRSGESVCWASIRKEVTDMVESCSSCIKERRMINQPLTTTELPEGPWQEIASDMFYFDGKSYAILVKHYSRWIEVLEMRDQTDQEEFRNFRNQDFKSGNLDQ